MYELPVPCGPTAPAASFRQRLTIFRDGAGRDGLLVFSGGSETGYRPHLNSAGQVHLGYLLADGTEQMDQRLVEYRWVDPAELTAVGTLP